MMSLSLMFLVTPAITKFLRSVIDFPYRDKVKSIFRWILKAVLMKKNSAVLMDSAVDKVNETDF